MVTGNLRVKILLTCKACKYYLKSVGVIKLWQKHTAKYYKHIYQLKKLILCPF